MNTKKMSEVIKGNMAVYEGKTKQTLVNLILLGMLAGAFIAIGAASSSAAVYGIENVGLAKCLAGTIFPVGLVLVVLVGGELFTGDCLMIFGVMDKRIKALSMIRVLAIVWISNLVGSLIIVFLVNKSGQLDYGNAVLGATTIKTAFNKMNMGFTKAFFSAIMCNILVCFAVLVAATSADVAGKILGIFFTIWAFVIGGYEHCVANMYYIPAGILAKSNPTYYSTALAQGMHEDQLSFMTVGHMFVNNLLPVTLGNIVGGMIVVALPLYLVNRKAIKED
jgi:formate/nitrite transporter